MVDLQSMHHTGKLEVRMGIAEPSRPTTCCCSLNGPTDVQRCCRCDHDVLLVEPASIFVLHRGETVVNMDSLKDRFCVKLTPPLSDRVVHAPNGKILDLDSASLEG